MSSIIRTFYIRHRYTESNTDNFGKFKVALHIVFHQPTMKCFTATNYITVAFRQSDAQHQSLTAADHDRMSGELAIAVQRGTIFVAKLASVAESTICAAHTRLQ